MLLKNKYLKRVKTVLMHRAPRILIAASRVAGRTVLFKEERRFLAGKSTPRSESPSVLFLSYNRCGSMYVSSLLKALTTASHTPIDLGQYAFHGDPSLKPKLADPTWQEEHFRSQGYFYVGFRSPMDFVSLEEFKTLIVLRDPRDVLTSRFFSVAFAHMPSDAKFIADRKRAQEMGIDAFVLERIEEVRKPYETYVSKVIGRPNVLHTRYEDMVTDFEPWLEKVAAHVCPSPDKEVIARLIAESDFKPATEDKYSHKRSVQPGSYKSKLKPETIAAVEAAFADLLPALGYIA